MVPWIKLARPVCHCLLAFGLANAAQSIKGRHLSLQASNTAANVVHTLAFKVLHALLFTAMEWSSP